MKEVAILPDQVPVMPLPGAVLFPHALLPLYIFEPRYREMLAHALAHERMFCVALLRPDSAQWKSEDDFFDVGTIGLIRACVGRGNGTSNLILQGLQRVCFADFVQLHPFPIAEFEPLLGIGEYLQRAAPPQRHAVAQIEIGLLEVGELPATGSGRKQHRKCGVLRKFDLRDRIHHDGQTSGFRHRQLHPQKRDVTGIAGGIPIC